MTISSLTPPKKWNDLIKLKEFITDCDGFLLRLRDDENYFNLYKKLVPKDITLQLIKELIGKRKTAIVINNFPYTRLLEFQPTVKHYCLWSLKGKLSDIEIKKRVDAKFPKKMWFYMERKLNFKSVPEIWHCHIFVKMS